jgi:hypothetical protein
MEIGEQIESPTLGLALTWREMGAEVLAFDMTMQAGAPAIPMHVHPRQEERITVVRGTVRSRSGGRERLLTAGEYVVTPPGEAHTIEPAAGADADVRGELRPALAYGQFIERSFALDRAGHINPRGRANPLRMAATGVADAEFFLTGPPVAVQRPLLRLLAWLGHRLGYEHD